MHKERSFRTTSRRRLDESIHAAYTLARRAGIGEAYERLLSQVRRQTTLLLPARDPDRIGRSSVNAWLLAMTLHQADWLRPVELWQPPPANPLPQLSSLACHLFALYPMPAFMTSAWFQVPPDKPHPEQEWYKHLGRGGSIRSAGLPLAYTRAMAHHFLQAPAHYRVVAALRWGQVRGLGGTPALARAVVATRLGRELANEDFWLTVLRFFVQHPDMDTAHVGPVVDFLRHQRFETQEVFVPGQGNVRQGPPQPDHSLKGRTLASLLRQVEEWHGQLARDNTLPALCWARCRIGEMHHVEGTAEQESQRCWTMRELLTSRELFLEGQALRHCVASYACYCVHGATTIWSLQVDTGDGPKRALTVEVHPASRTIRQARGKANRLPRACERAVLEQWAAQQGLRFAEHL
jgi:hypothetical protein